MVESASPKEKRTIYFVQGLRAFAAAQILAEHILMDIEHRFHVDTAYLTKLPLFTGVDVFFCVSGFIMMLTSWDHFAEPGYRATFLRHRFARVVPMYYVFTTLIIVVGLAIPGMLQATTITPMQVVSSYLFFPYARGDGLAQPILSVGWTLNYEMFFYVVFSLCLWFRRATAFTLMVGIFGCLSVLHVVFPQAPTCVVFWTDPLTLEFVAGAGIAYLYRCDVRIRTYSVVAIAGIVAALVIFYTRDAVIEALGLQIPRVLEAGGPALLLLACCTLLVSNELDGKMPVWLRSLGDSSYALYLSHRFGMRLAAVLWSMLLTVFHPGTEYTMLYGAGVFVICIGLGEIVHRWLEKPVTRALIKGMRSRRPQGKPLAYRPNQQLG